jgi:hypothetical protein
MGQLHSTYTAPTVFSASSMLLRLMIAKSMAVMGGRPWCSGASYILEEKKQSLKPRTRISGSRFETTRFQANVSQLDSTCTAPAVLALEVARLALQAARRFSRLQLDVAAQVG